LAGTGGTGPAHLIPDELVVGRQAGKGGLTLPSDTFMGRHHFVIRTAGSAGFVLEDLKSRNGTAVNDAQKRIESRLLRDGDIIFAGSQFSSFFVIIQAQGEASLSDLLLQV